MATAGLGGPSGPWVPCAPTDAFFDADRAFAERLWGRGDNGTVSQRLAEHVAATTGSPVRKTKTALHGVLSIGAFLLGAYAVTRMTNDPTAVVVGLTGSAVIGGKLFAYLERDRCS